MTVSTPLHPDWVLREGQSEYDSPEFDFRYALDHFPAYTAEPIPELLTESQCVTSDDVARVDAYFVSYYSNEPWKPGDERGTELKLVAIAELKDGRWLSVEGWNDYTGWGCGEASDVRVGATRLQVIHYGLTLDARARLGLTA